MADDGTQAHGQLGADVTLGVLGKEIAVARDGALGVAGVQRGEDEMAGLRGTKRHLRGFLVADLADQDDVGILP